MLFSSILASTKTCAWQLTNNLKVSTLYKKLCQRFSLLLCKEEILSQVCLIYVICFCNLRMWKDLNKSYLTSIKLCVSSFLYGPRANIIGTEVMGFIYTGFRPSHFEVMAVTDIKLVFIQILSHSQVTEAIVFFSLQLSSYIPSWRLQKNADGHISSLGDLWYGPSYQKYQKWREHELNISLDKVVL